MGRWGRLGSLGRRGKGGQMDDGRLLPKGGGYRRLLSFRKAQIIYDLTVAFCRRYLSRDARTTDQMVQAARSGKQNIAEGSMASATSRETEIKLTNVARASLEELLLDYEDYLRTRGLRLWDKDSPESLFMRKASLRHDHSEWFLNLAHSRNDEVFANMAVCLIHQAAFLLKKQLNVLEERFLQEGGLRERMTRLRKQRRKSGSS
jgi:four helix bundle suffix protein